jgi:urocanate hydratase
VTGGEWREDLVAQKAVLAAYEMYSTVGERHFISAGGAEPGDEATLAGRLIVCGGMGERGGVHPLAATMTGAAFLGIEVDAERIKRRLRSGECDFLVHSLDEALRILKNALRKRENLSVGLVGNCAELLPQMAERGVLPDLLTDQTPLPGSGHNRDNPEVPCYVPAGMTPAEASALCQRDAAEYTRRARESMTRHIEAMLRLQQMGAVTFDSGNGLRAEAQRLQAGGGGALPEPAAECEAVLAAEGSRLAWVALSGQARALSAIDELALGMLVHRPRLCRWIEQARRRIRRQGFALRVARLPEADQAALALAVNALVREGKIASPVAFEGEAVSGANSPIVADGSEDAARQIKRAWRSRT